MKRTLIKLTLFLVLGAIVNVAVAWGLTEFMAPFTTPWAGPLGDRRETPGFVERAHCEIPQNFAKAWDVDSGARAIGYNVYRLRTLGSQIGHHLQSEALVVGLPVASMWGRHWYYADPAQSPSAVVSEEETGIEVAGHWLPTTTLWPGFAINTVFYAAVLRLSLAAPFALRRMRGAMRRRRGLCPACAYPIGESDRCTECGHRLVHSNA